MGQVFQLQATGVNQFDDVTPVVARPVPGSGIIDVVRDFPWTGTPLTQYQVEKTPYIMLHEFDLTTNAAVATFLYYKNFATSGIAASRDKLLSGLVDIAGDNAFTKSVKEIVGAGTTAVNAAVDVLESFSSSILRATGGTFNNVNLNDKYLQPYNLLYQRNRTGFKYVFPYMSPQRTITTEFGGSPEGLLNKNPLALGTMMKTAQEGIEQFASLFTLTSPGAFIEAPKYYNFGNDNESYQVKFHLINTRDRDTYQRNFELIFLLFYQNRAFRRSVSRVVPPKVYSARIPGITELPFCYMNSINVDFIGNRRNVTLNNPGLEGGTINCIIPDAYEVTIYLQSLLEPTANMMLSNELQSANYRSDPKQILQSIRNSIGIGGSSQSTFLQTPIGVYLRTPTTFNEQLLTSPAVSVRGIQTLNRLRGRL
jgi:hypothetical protein